MPIQVLLIEDNRPDALLVRNALQKELLAVAVQELRDADAAEDYLSRAGLSDDTPCPEIVVMDLHLPRGDGFEILRQIRTHPTCADIPVVVMTASESAADRARVGEFGNVRFFVKPSDLDAFLRIGAVVHEILEDRDRSAGSR
jgi:two-component system response regulator